MPAAVLGRASQKKCHTIVQRKGLSRSICVVRWSRVFLITMEHVEMNYSGILPGTGCLWAGFPQCRVRLLTLPCFCHSTSGPLGGMKWLIMALFSSLCPSLPPRKPSWSPGSCPCWCPLWWMTTPSLWIRSCPRRRRDPSPTPAASPRLSPSRCLAPATAGLAPEQQGASQTWQGKTACAKGKEGFLGWDSVLIHQVWTFLLTKQGSLVFPQIKFIYIKQYFLWWPFSHSMWEYLVFVFSFPGSECWVLGDIWVQLDECTCWRALLEIIKLAFLTPTLFLCQ